MKSKILLLYFYFLKFIFYLFNWKRFGTFYTLMKRGKNPYKIRMIADYPCRIDDGSLNNELAKLFQQDNLRYEKRFCWTWRTTSFNPFLFFYFAFILKCGEFYELIFLPFLILNKLFQRKVQLITGLVKLLD